MSKMTATFVTSAIALGALLSAAPSLDAQVFLSRNIPSDGACFYRDVGFRGDFFCLRAGENTNSLPPGLNDEVSSVRIFGRATVLIFEDAGFRGASVQFGDDAQSLETWNDRISSIRVQARFDGGRFGGSDGGSQQIPVNGACFYKDADFRGDFFCLEAGTNSNVMPLGMNDEVSSVRILGRASVLVYQDGAFRGESVQLNDNVRNLATGGWNDLISSIRVQGGGFGNGGRFGGGGGNGGGRPPVDGGGGVPRQGACFYSDAGFQGQRFCLARGQSAGMLPLGFNDEISSVQLYGGASVTIYEHEGFGGQSIGISNSMQNLSGARSPNGFAWNDQISSIRVN